MALVRTASILIAIICQSKMVMASDVKVFSTKDLDNPGLIEQAKFQGTNDVLAQKAALDMDRIVTSLTEFAAKIYSATNNDGKYQIVVRSEQEFSYNVDKLMDLYDRTFEVTFLGPNKDHISVIQTGFKISEK